jgi:hypothetical protein
MSGNIFEEFPGFAGDGADGDDFAPEVRALCDSAEAEDTSWHNNACPSVTFMLNDTPRVVLWDGGRDPAAREVQDGRFGVMACRSDSSPLDGMTYEGDDAEAAVAVFRRLVKELDPRTFVLDADDRALLIAALEIVSPDDDPVCANRDDLLRRMREGGAR